MTDGAGQGQAHSRIQGEFLLGHVILDDTILVGINGLCSSYHMHIKYRM